MDILSKLFCGSMLVLLALAALPVFFRRKKEPRYRLTRGYNVRRNCDGYPVTTDRKTALFLSSSGEYTYEGPAGDSDGPAAGGYYTNDGTGGSGMFVPPGYFMDESETD